MPPRRPTRIIQAKQRAVLNHRAALVQLLYAGLAPAIFHARCD